MITPKTKIVIVGGGVGGLELATKLGDKLGRKNKAEIILVDHNPQYVWKPMLHAVATGSIDENLDSLSYLAQASNHYFNFQLGHFTDIDRTNKNIKLIAMYDPQGQLLLPERRLNFDILVCSLGSISNDFGTMGVKEHCIVLDDLKHAHQFHKKLLNLVNSHSIIQNEDNPINIVIVGGGATGVELSAELYNSMKQLTHYGFKWLNENVLHVTLIEASDRILPSLPIRMAKTAHYELTKLGVRILTKTIVTSVYDRGVNTNTGEQINADIIVWSAGIKVPDFMQKIGGLVTNHINQLVVKSTLQTTLDNAIFAIGDCASCPQKNGRFVPPRAQAAHQMANICYKNIIALLANKELKEYIYHDHGSLVSLSSFSTIGNLMCGNIIIEGKIARIIYLLLYRINQIALHGYIKTGLLFLISSLNKLIRPKLKLY